jgi:hypothetical protein
LLLLFVSAVLPARILPFLLAMLGCLLFDLVLAFSVWFVAVFYTICICSRFTALQQLGTQAYTQQQ